MTLYLVIQAGVDHERSQCRLSPKAESTVHSGQVSQSSRQSGSHQGHRFQSL